MPLDRVIAEVVSAFQAAPHDFFHEKELHGLFYGLARPRFGVSETADNHPISLLRHEYETIWLYQKKNTPEPFAARYPEQGAGVRATTGCFDFALLSRQFAAANNLITVINKFETSRARLRPPTGLVWAADQCSVALDAALEFKMAHRRHQVNIGQGQINQLRDGMLLDCRKLALERVPVCYALGFSHGPGPTREEATCILRACQAEFNLRYDGLPRRCVLRAMVVTHDHAYFAADWPNPPALPGPKEAV